MDHLKELRTFHAFIYQTRSSTWTFLIRVMPDLMIIVKTPVPESLF